MDRQTAIRKVLRCLRLAASSNPNEAAAALRQARAMMTEHGLTEADAYASEIQHADAPTRCRGAVPSRSLMFLIDVVSAGFRCDVVVVTRPGPNGEGQTVVTFFGAGADAQVGAYAFVVLRRQLESDKGRYTRRIRKRANKEKRGEEFALGWVAAVRRQFPCGDLTDERKAAIAAAMASKHTNLTQVTGREIGKHGRANWNDCEAGYVAGSRARVNPGLSESAQRKLGAT